MSGRVVSDKYHELLMSFLKSFTTFASVLYRIYIQTLAFGSSLYIRYNTAAHVVNSTNFTIKKLIRIEKLKKLKKSQTRVHTKPLQFRYGFSKRAQIVKI